jgi:hypothetical protein
MATSSKALPTEVGMLVVRSRFNIQRSLQVEGSLQTTAHYN